MSSTASVPSPDHLQTATTPLRRASLFLAQVCFFVAIFIVASRLQTFTRVPLSAGILGLLLVYVLLSTRVLPVTWVRRGATWLLGELVLFFIPCVIEVMRYADLFRHEGVQIVLAITVGTILVMVSTALAVHAGCKLEDRLAQRRGRAPSSHTQADYAQSDSTQSGHTS